MSDILDKIFAEVCVDDRIPDGVFDMSNNVHMEVLRETLMDNYQVNINDAKVIHNKMVEGKYPERQAYNKDGLLVTFPTPQHKQKAISRGTHFEKDPTAGTPNVFGGEQPQGQQGQPAAPGGAPAAPAGGAAPGGAPPSEEPSPSPEGSQQNIFPTGQEQPEQTPEEPVGQGAPSSQLPASDTPQEPKAPAGSGGGAPSALPASDAPTPSTVQQGGQTLAVEPQGNAQDSATVPAPPPDFSTPKAPEQRAAEAEVVKGIMNTDDTSTDTRYSLSEQWARVEEFCVEKGYRGALKVVQGMKSIHSIMEDMSKRK